MGTGVRTAMRTVVAAVVALAVVGGWAGPASADPPEPSDFRSTVTSVVPASDAFTVSVVGGDSLLALHVEPGHEVIVEGYYEEPYLRFRPDGVVEENTNASTTYLNDQRYVELTPTRRDDDAEPVWRQVADDGSYAWHDHRAHWMSPRRPADAQPGDVLLPWTLPLTVDGEPVVVDGELVVEARPTWWPWIVGVVAVAAAVWLAVRRRPGWRTAVPLVVLGVAAALALAVAASEQLSFPSEAGRRILPVMLPAAALACVLTAAAIRRTTAAPVVALAAVATVAGWALLRLAVFTKPVLPTDLSPTLDRAATALALGLTAGAALVLTVTPRPTTPVDEPPDDGDNPTSTHDLAEVS